jgi:hypothetical protein
MHRAVAEFMVAEPAAAGNDDLELVGLVEVRPGDGARPLLDQESHRVQRIVGRRLLVRQQGVAVRANIGGGPANRRLASAGAAREDTVGDPGPRRFPYRGYAFRNAVKGGGHG